MRISLVIPTRERIATLRSCLELALSCDDPDLEVVVSDNHSMDGTDAYLATMTDPRLKVVRPEGRVAMRLNFETGLNAATGDYVIVIGDDDGVLPSGLRWLRAVLEKDRPEVGDKMKQYYDKLVEHWAYLEGFQEAMRRRGEG